VPTRDRPALLRRAVDSALAQAGASVEVVVVDDGSAEPVQLPGDPRLRVVRHAASRGGSAAGTGTTEGTGRFVTYLDDDDTLLPHLAARRCRPTPRRWSAARCSVFRR
jgi:glycosyltransferase involved in cell wall biosynthesis